jgi:hypothetical protein
VLALAWQATTVDDRKRCHHQETSHPAPTIQALTLPPSHFPTAGLPRPVALCCRAYSTPPSCSQTRLTPGASQDTCGKGLALFPHRKTARTFLRARSAVQNCDDLLQVQLEQRQAHAAARPALLHQQKYFRLARRRVAVPDLGAEGQVRGVEARRSGARARAGQARNCFARTQMFNGGPPFVSERWFDYVWMFVY